MRTEFFPVVAISLLSACGGASTTTPSLDFDPGALAVPMIDTTTPGIPAFNSAEDVALEAIAITDEIGALGLTAPADFPRTGSALFTGAIVLNDRSAVEQATVAGGLTLGINFEDEAEVTALAGNFFDLGNTRVDGTLSMRGVEFSEGTVGGGFVGDLTGTLHDVGRAGENDSYTYDIEMASIYYGPGIQGVLVIAGGTATDTDTLVERQMSGAATVESD